MELVEWVDGSRRGLREVDGKGVKEEGLIYWTSSCR